MYRTIRSFHPARILSAVLVMVALMMGIVAMSAASADAVPKQASGEARDECARLDGRPAEFHSLERDCRIWSTEPIYTTLPAEFHTKPPISKPSIGRK